MSRPLWHWIVGGAILVWIAYTIIRDILREKRGACVLCGETHPAIMTCKTARGIRSRTPLIRCPRCQDTSLRREPEGGYSCKRCNLWF